MFKLLIAEDVKTVRETLARSIPWEKLGISLLGTAENGEEALAWLDRGREQPDVLLTDIGMPKMNGLALIEAFKAHKPDIRCVILSGLNEFEHARKAIKLQVQEYILKPIDPGEIAEVFANVVRELREEREARSGASVSGHPPGERPPRLPDAPQAGEWSGDLKKRKLVDQAIRYMKAHYMRKDLALPDVAAAVGLSDKYLNVLVKEVTGATINHAIIRFRMEEAARLLQDPSNRIYEICERIGYADLDHFREVFKRQYGVTPTEYRNGHA
ncbi:response regulator transcription factor [Paenibacillus glycinis]|uniref:Response regulator n=1 Tax=Paenibacillus glycinis TaxID=2697035 RepID=A0ABW9XSL9_9BACL|nr:response regulator [Paenibacillus glycinis]NBD25473.1 response regulator [Paenibacillus glycinis]